MVIIVLVDMYYYYIDDLLLSSTSSTMTSPIKLENHSNRPQHLQHQHGAMVNNLHLSEVITTAAATGTHHYNGLGTHRHSIVDPIEMTKLLSNITTSNSSSSKAIPTSSTMDDSSRLNHFSWEEIEGRYLPVIFRYIYIYIYKCENKREQLTCNIEKKPYRNVTCVFYLF